MARAPQQGAVDCALCKGAAIAAEDERFRCVSNTCDDLVLCLPCGESSGRACPHCGGRLYRDHASPLLLRTRVFKEAFPPTGDRATTTPCDASAEAVVHPWVMVGRALEVYQERPLIGEPTDDGSVRWWSYEQCRLAVASLAADLRAQVAEAAAPAAAAGAPCAGHASHDCCVVLCARNSAGWLLADWACVLARLPSIAADASTPAREALELVTEAARFA